MFKNSLKLGVTALSVSGILALTGCSSSSSDSVTGSGSSVVGGTVDLGNIASRATSSARGISQRNTPNCGSGGSVQLYDISDNNYSEPLLSEPVSISSSDCKFDVQSTNFKDSTKAGSNNKYLVRTIVEDNGKKIEMSAAKMGSGTNMGKVDPIAHMFKTKIAQIVKMLEETFTSMGVTLSDEILNQITKTLEDQMETLVADFQKEIDQGKVKIQSSQFETSKGFDDTLTEEEMKEMETREADFASTVGSSGVGSSFAAFSNNAKAIQMKNVTVNESDLRGRLTKGVANIKYGIIESFVKQGLSVHDGDGKLIVFMPVPFDEKDELPGKKYQLQYTDSDGNQGTVGNDFAIRVIDPEKDLNRANGNEIWFHSLNAEKPRIPSNVINEIILKRDNTITMEELGKVIHKFKGGDGNTDVFAGTDMYSVTMSESSEDSIKSIMNVFKNDFIKMDYEHIMFDSLDRTLYKMETGTSKADVIAEFLKKPFIAKDPSETEATFLARLEGDTDSIGFILNDLGLALSNGIPLSDTDGNIQFKSGTTITSSTKVKPIAGLALVNMYMEAKGNSGSISFAKADLATEFGWMLESGDSSFNGKKIWKLNYGGGAPGGEDLSLSEQTAEDKEGVVGLAEKLTGLAAGSIKVERSFDKMNQNFRSIMEKIQKKGNNGFNFEQQFKGELVDFGDSETVDATVSFELKDFEQNAITDKTLKLVPIFENFSSFERKPITGQGDALVVDLTVNGGRYEASGIKVFNFDKNFDENGNGSENGEYKFTGDYDVWLIDGSDKQPISMIPIFPGTNNLDFPVFYDSGMKFENFDPTAGGEGPDFGPEKFFEHSYLDSDGSVFFPQLVKKDDSIVGENLFSYSKTTKTFTKSLTNGAVNGSSMTITVLYKSYDDQGGKPSIVDDIDMANDGIGEGAIIQLKLSGGQVKDQTIDMEIIYVGDNGDVEVRLSKENSGSGGEVFNPKDMLEDRFAREGSFTFKNGAVQKTGDFADLTFNADGTITYDSETYSFVFENFDSVAMVDSSNTFVDFLFIKESFVRTADIVSGDISGKTLVFDDGVMEVTMNFAAGGGLTGTEAELRDTANTTITAFFDSGTWAIEKGAIKLTDIGSNPVGYLVVVKGSSLVATSKVVFSEDSPASIDGDVPAISPIHEVSSLTNTAP